MKRKADWPLRIVVTVLASACLVFGYVFFYPYVEPLVLQHVFATRFDESQWKNADLRSTIRLRMVTDLIIRHELRSMTRPEIEALLGPGIGSEPNQLQYVVAPGFMDPQVLYIEVLPNDSVRSVMVGSS